MKLAHFYESVGQVDPLDPSAAPADAPWRVELANEVVQHLRNEYDRFAAYEEKYSPTLDDEKDDVHALEVLRSIWQMFEAWVEEAEPVYQRVRRLPAASQLVSGLDELRDDIGFSLARLALTPEDELRGACQLRRGEGIRTTVEAFRDDLRARRGA
jgi:hypothetical protein